MFLFEKPVLTINELISNSHWMVTIRTDQYWLMNQSSTNGNWLYAVQSGFACLSWTNQPVTVSVCWQEGQKTGPNRTCKHYPCHTMTSAHIPCGWHQLPTLSFSIIVKVPHILLFPNLGYVIILCSSFMYTLHLLHLHYPWPKGVFSAPYIRPPFMYVLIISNIN